MTMSVSSLFGGPGGGKSAEPVGAASAASLSVVKPFLPSRLSIAVALGLRPKDSRAEVGNHFRGVQGDLLGLREMTAVDEFDEPPAKVSEVRVRSGILAAWSLPRRRLAVSSLGGGSPGLARLTRSLAT